MSSARSAVPARYRRVGLRFFVETRLQPGRWPAVPQSPHDALFRFTFGNPENAAALIRSNLPERIASRIDWRSLRLESGSYVDPSAQWRHSDLVFTAKIDGRAGFLYVLLEHQSSPDPLMPLRMLGYVVRLWEELARRKAKTTRLPAVLPLVVYHGDTAWNAPTRLVDIIDLDDVTKIELAPHLPELAFVLDDLTARGEQQIRGRRLPVAAMLTALSLPGFPKGDAIARCPSSSTSCASCRWTAVATTPWSRSCVMCSMSPSRRRTLRRSAISSLPKSVPTQRRAS